MKKLSLKKNGRIKELLEAKVVLKQSIKIPLEKKLI
nr:MAG TPA: hypothetical protein [Caudoviricetes sp.]